MLAYGCHEPQGEVQVRQCISATNARNIRSNPNGGFGKQLH